MHEMEKINRKNNLRVKIKSIIEDLLTIYIYLYNFWYFMHTSTYFSGLLVK